MQTQTNVGKTKSKKKIPHFNPDHDLPGLETQVPLSLNEPFSSPSGRQFADNPKVSPPFHFSPDNHPSKRTRPSEIVGWGADLDVKNRPGYPMERMPPRDIGVHWDQPERQVPKMKIYHSVERAGITPVFGTSVPPKGLSGALRTLAFRLSENDIRHWLLLMGADRINEVEGILEDLAHGHIPNFFKEKGLKAELKHNPMGMVKRVARVALVVGVSAYFLNRKFGKRSPRRTSRR
jgi:hypothetical protein